MSEEDKKKLFNKVETEFIRVFGQDQFDNVLLDCKETFNTAEYSVFFPFLVGHMNAMLLNSKFNKCARKSLKESLKEKE